MNMVPALTKYTAYLTLATSLSFAGNALSEEASQPSSPDVSSSFVSEKGVPGGVETQTARMKATVADIDHEARTVTLEGSDGDQQTITAGPDVINFEQIEKGDQISIVYREETVVRLLEPGEDAANGAGAVSGGAEEGEKPGAFSGGLVQITVVVKDVNLENHTATLAFPDGSNREVQVRDDVELSKDQVGKELMIQKTVAVAVSVEKQE